MNKIDKAAYIIENYGLNCTTCNERKDICDICGTRARIAVEELINAGLLAPDLPEPNEMGDYLEQIWGTVRAGDGYVSFSTPTVLDHVGARFFAHALLAAANDAERKSND